MVLPLTLLACQGGGDVQLASMTTTTEVEQKIDSVLGCQLELPSGMTHYRMGQNFIWVSDDDVPTMRNICLYSYPGTSLLAEETVRKRDSVMQLNIRGEVENMYMHTESKVPVKQKLISWQGRQLLRTEGLWEMEGDAMGGPFVSHSRVDTLRGRIVVAEAFVYAPRRDKEETMKRLEAVLLKMKDKK